MKKFYLKGLIFFTIILALIAGVLFLSTKKPARTWLAEVTDSEDFKDRNEMLSFFKKASQEDGTTSLIIGDSICRQLFSGVAEQNPDTSILATNAALMVTGQYLMAEEYLQSHPETTDIYLVMHPLTITRTFDTTWSYRYAVMTYVETDTIASLDRNTVDIMKDVYGSLFLQKSVVQLIEDSPIARKLYLSYLNFNVEEYRQSSSFEIADQYIKKLYDLCQEKGVELHFHASPTAEYYREDMEALKSEYEQTWMYTQFPGYMNDMLYYPTEWSEDLSHFSGEYAKREKLNEVIERAYEGTKLLEKIDLY